MDQDIRALASALTGARSDDFNLLAEVVSKAGALALSYYGNAPRSQLKSDGTDVSEADLAVDELLKAALLGARPGYGWLSEESDHDPGARTSPLGWVVDPIDGTRAFLAEIPDWTISVALVGDNQPVLAVVFNPVKQEFYCAAHGAGGFLNGEPLKVSAAHDITGIKLAATQRMLERDIWQQPWPDRQKVWAKSIAYRLALTASGSFDASIFNMGNDWDVAAAHLLVEEAGGLITSLRGNPLTYDGSIVRNEPMIAAGPALHKALIGRLQ